MRLLKFVRILKSLVECDIIIKISERDEKELIMFYAEMQWKSKVSERNLQSNSTNHHA